MKDGKQIDQVENLDFGIWVIDSDLDSEYKSTTGLLAGQLDDVESLGSPLRIPFPFDLLGTVLEDELHDVTVT